MSSNKMLKSENESMRKNVVICLQGKTHQEIAMDTS